MSNRLPDYEDRAEMTNTRISDRGRKTRTVCEEDEDGGRRKEQRAMNMGTESDEDEIGGR